jgi:hypothetical protein
MEAASNRFARLIKGRNPWRRGWIPEPEKPRNRLGLLPGASADKASSRRNKAVGGPYVHFMKGIRPCTLESRRPIPRSPTNFVACPDAPIRGGYSCRWHRKRERARAIFEVGTGQPQSSTGHEICNTVVVVLFHIWMAFLVTATLLWGGCQSCPRFFMFPWEKTDFGQKHCCSNAGKCSRPAGKTQQDTSTSSDKSCKRIALESAEQIGVDAPMASSTAVWTLSVDDTFAGFQQVPATDSPPGKRSFSILRI